MSDDAEDETPSRSDIREDRANIRKLFDKVNSIAVDIGVIKTTLSLRKECPDPGLCIDLKKDIESVKTDVADLKTTRAELRFGASSWIWLGAAVLSIGGLIAEAKIAFGK